MTSLALAEPAPSGPLGQMRAASPLLWWTSVVFLGLFAASIALALVDPRLFNGVSTWAKPAKFFLSLAIHMLTLGAAIALLPQSFRPGWQTRVIAGTMASMAILEMAYIAFQASRGEASHFNVSSPLTTALYNAMGLGAAAMMVVTIWLGVLVLRKAPRTTLAIGMGSGLLMAGALTLAAGFTLGGMGSHWIGGDQTDATGLPLFGWSTTGGDLRVSHFLATHLAQAMPLAALAGRPGLVVVAALAGLALTAATYVQALMGYPLIPL
jgi:hypothetical protein